MPDAFGQETPQEAIARVQGSFRQQNQRFQNSAAFSSKGAQAGQALANIFGGVTKQFIDTRRDRKSEAARLAAEQGISQEEARDLAKQNIPFGHSEVRQAKTFKRLSEEADQHTADLTTGGVNPEIARASGMIMLASKLRAQGFSSEASKMTQQAMEVKRAEETRLFELDNLRQRTAASRASELSSLASANQAGETNFTKLVNRSELLQTQIDLSDDPQVIARLERMQGDIDAQIAKLNTITGTTEQDPGFLSTAGKNKQATEIIEGKVLQDSLEMLESDLVDAQGDFAASSFGRLTSKGIGFAERFFNRTPTEDEQEFVQRVKDTHGGLAFIAADIRHALTGAAMSPAEAVFLEPFLPLPSDSRTEALAKTRLLIRYTQADVRIRTELLNSSDDTRRSYMENLQKETADQLKRETEAQRQRDVLDNNGISTPTETDDLVQQAIDASNRIAGE